MEPTKVYPIVAFLSLVTVEYGGWALLSFITATALVILAVGIGRA